MWPRKKERKQTTQGRDGRTVHRHHTGILRRGECGASRHLPLGVCLFLSLFAVCRRFSLQPSCHPVVLMPPRGLPTLVVLPPVASTSVAPLSSASFCSATAACRSLALAVSRLLLPLGAVRHPKKERKQTTQGRDGRTVHRHHTGIF